MLLSSSQLLSGPSNETAVKLFVKCFHDERHTLEHPALIEPAALDFLPLDCQTAKRRRWNVCRRQVFFFLKQVQTPVEVLCCRSISHLKCDTAAPTTFTGCNFLSLAATVLNIGQIFCKLEGDGHGWVGQMTKIVFCTLLAYCSK